MKLNRMAVAAALTVAAALALGGCAAETTTTTPTAAPTASGACIEVRDVTNGALNTLAGDVGADPSGTADYLASLADRVDALLGTVDNAGADEAFADFSTALSDAGSYIETIPVSTDDASAEVAEPDPALTLLTSTVQDTALQAASHCRPE